MTSTSNDRVLEAPDMPLFPPKLKNDPVLPISAKMRQSLVEQIDWIAQREGYSRAFAIETAVELLITQYETENGLKAGRIPYTSAKKAHRTSPKSRKPKS